MKNSPQAYCSFYRDDFGKVWLSAYTGLYLYDRATDTFTRMLNDPEARGFIGRGLCRFLKHNKAYGYWVGVNKGYYKFTNEFQKEYLLSFNHDYETGFRVDEEGTVWYCNSQGIQKVIRKQINFSSFIYDHSNKRSVSSIVTDDSLYWISDFKEIHGYTYDFNLVKSLKFHDGIYDPKINPSIQHLLLDREGRLWMGSMDKGVYRCDDLYTKQEITRFFPGSGHRSDIPDKKVLMYLLFL